MPEPRCVHCGQVRLSGVHAVSRSRGGHPFETRTTQPRMAVVRWKERDGVIHADNPLSDYTLCGYALEGEDGNDELTRVQRGKISCAQCVTLIAHCKAIPARVVRRA